MAFRILARVQKLFIDTSKHETYKQHDSNEKKKTL